MSSQPYDREFKQKILEHVLLSYDDFLDFTNHATADAKLTLMLCMCGMIDAAKSYPAENQPPPWNLALLGRQLSSVMSRFAYNPASTVSVNVDRFVASILDAPPDTVAGHCL